MAFILALLASLQFPCSGPNVEHGDLVRAAPGWAFAVVDQEHACTETPAAIVGDLLTADIPDPFAPAATETATRWDGPLTDDDPYADDGDEPTVVFDPWADIYL